VLSSMRINFYTHAGYCGYGHIIRCIALATELKRQGHECYFWGNKDATDRAAQSGLTSNEFIPDCRDGNTYFPSANTWVVDLEGGCPPRYAIAAKRASKNKLVILSGVGYSDIDPGRLLADLVFYQGVTDRPATLDWTGFKGRWFAGVEYLILRDEFRGPQITQLPQAQSKIIIAGGGSDPKNITLKALQAIEKDNMEHVALIGPSNHFDYFAAGYPRIVRNPRDVAAELAWADVAVVSYGMTAFECLALGIPTVALSISPDHKDSADLAQAQSSGALVSLGEVEDVTLEQIRAAVYSQLARQATLSKLAREFVDGRGVARVAELILEVM